MTETHPTPQNHDMSIFRLPRITRSAKLALDRSLFTKTVPISAARVFTLQNLSKYRHALEKSKEMLTLERIMNIRLDPDPEIAERNGKCLLLWPEAKVDEPNTWSEALREAVESKEAAVIPYDLVLDYKYWTHYDILEAALPEEVQGEIPVGFSTVGHIAHLNLRPEYLPYKNLIATVLVDKSHNVRTVINKTHDVGTHSEYRTFGYEVLYGPDDMNVEVKEADCIFKFDYSKVYWNSRLQTEHERLVDLLKPGEVLCDVMAGVGPFAVPAGKKLVHVWANDLNPESFESLKGNIERNKVEAFVHPSNTDGRDFIRNTASHLLTLFTSNQNKFMLSIPKTPTTHGKIPISPRRYQQYTIPPTIAHFIMNLPATAISFLPTFIGLYQGREKLFEPYTTTKLPMVHVHCFAAKGEGKNEVLSMVEDSLGTELDKSEDGETYVREVRDVAPGKRMYCAGFRLPAAVAFAERKELEELTKSYAALGH